MTLWHEWTRGSWSTLDLNASSSLKNIRKKGFAAENSRYLWIFSFWKNPRNCTAIREHLLKCLPQGKNQLLTHGWSYETPREDFYRNINKIIPKREHGQTKILQDNAWNNKHQTRTDPSKICSQSPNDKERLHERTKKSTAKSNTWLSYLAEESNAPRERFWSSPGLSAQLFQSYLLQVVQYAKLSSPQHIAPNICPLLWSLSTLIFRSKLRHSDMLAFHVIFHDF